MRFFFSRRFRKGNGKRQPSRQDTPPSAGFVLDVGLYVWLELACGVGLHVVEAGHEGGTYIQHIHEGAGYFPNIIDPCSEEGDAPRD